MFVVCFVIIALLSLFVQASSCLDVIYIAINTNIAMDLGETDILFVELLVTSN